MRNHILDAKQIENLKNYVAKKIKKEDCDETLKHTKIWIQNNIVTEKRDAVLNEIKSDGGYCDCEMLMNSYRY